MDFVLRISFAVLAGLVISLAVPGFATAGEILGGDAYPLNVCVVSGKALDSMGGPVDHEYKGRTIRFCCKGCVPGFEKDPEKYLEKVNAAVVKKQLAHYPLDVCVVSGQKLGSMGSPVNHVVGNRLFRLCCKGCVKAVEASAKKHSVRLNAAVVKKQLPTYKLATCPVSGGKLGSMGEPVSYVLDNRLVRLCCKGCVKAVEKDPDAILAKLGESGSPSKADHDG